MIAIELKLPERTYAALRQAAAQSQKTESEVALDAIQSYLAQITAIDPLLGMFADDPVLIDQVEADAMQSREQAKWRLSEVDSG